MTWPKGLGCKGYRLPTEAEWEYAAQAEERTRYAGSDKVDEVAWYGENAEARTRPVAGRKPNPWGLYDMSGNVWEWVWDWHAPYAARPQTDPLGPLQDGSARVFRGGSWADAALLMRVADRVEIPPGFRYPGRGFRLSRSYP